MFEHIRALGGHVEFNTTLTGLEQDENGVSAEMTKNIGGQIATEKSRFTYVVGADGARSEFVGAIVIIAMV